MPSSFWRRAPDRYQWLATERPWEQTGLETLARSSQRSTVGCGSHHWFPPNLLPQRRKSSKSLNVVLAEETEKAEGSRAVSLFFFSFCSRCFSLRLITSRPISNPRVPGVGRTKPWKFYQIVVGTGKSVTQPQWLVTRRLSTIKLRRIAFLSPLPVVADDLSAGVCTKKKIKIAMGDVRLVLQSVSWHLLDPQKISLV